MKIWKSSFKCQIAHICNQNFNLDGRSYSHYPHPQMVNFPALQEVLQVYNASI